MTDHEVALVVAAVIEVLTDRKGVGDELAAIAREAPDVMQEILEACHAAVIRVVSASPTATQNEA